MLGEVGGVGGEVVAGQAGVAALARMQPRQQADAVGEDAVGALVEPDQLVDITGIELERPPVTVDLGERRVASLRGLLAERAAHEALLTSATRRADDRHLRGRSPSYERRGPYY